ncbi:MAG TPA: AtpZ/AtpI family protein [Candidatus Saccharimonadales bacterium]
MKKTIAPSQTPSPTSGEKRPTPGMGRNEAARSDFFAAALTMSWQLAIVVLVPIIGGFKLDQKLNTSPWLVIVGFVIAMAGTGLVMWQAMQTANRMAAQGSSK